MTFSVKSTITTNFHKRPESFFKNLKIGVANFFVVIYNILEWKNSEG